MHKMFLFKGELALYWSACQHSRAGVNYVRKFCNGSVMKFFFWTEVIFFWNKNGYCFKVVCT